MTTPSRAATKTLTSSGIMSCMYMMSLGMMSLGIIIHVPISSYTYGKQVKAIQLKYKNDGTTMLLLLRLYRYPSTLLWRHYVVTFA